MRWPFGRSSRPADGSTPSGSADRPPIDRPHDAWRSLPAVQRASGEPPTVAPAAPFAASLATRQPPALTLAPLGHEISPLGSPGIVVGLVAPSGAAITGRPELPIQRLASESDRDMPGAAGWSSFESANVGLESVSGGAPEPPQSEPAADLPSPVQRLAEAAPALTSANATSIPATPAGTFDLRPVAQRPHPGSTAPALASVQPIPFEPVVAPAATFVAESPGRRPTLGQARRLGLGVPLSSIAEQAVQRTAVPVAGVARTATGTTLAGSPEPVAGASATAAPQREPVALTVVRPISIQRLAPDLPGGPLQPGRLSQSAGASLTGLTGLAELAAPAGAKSAAGLAPAGGSGPALLPLVAEAVTTMPEDTPLSLQRLPDAPLGGQSIRVSAAGSLLLPAEADGAPSPAPAAQVRPAGGSEQSVGRLGADPGRSVETAIRPRAVQASGFGGPARPDPSAPAVLRMVGSARPAVGVMDPGPVLTLAPALPVQRAVEINEVQVNPTVPDPTAGGVAGSGAGSAGSPGQPPGAAGSSSTVDRDRELDDLARRLYGRIRSRLTSELLGDRERAGVITDLR